MVKRRRAILPRGWHPPRAGGIEESLAGGLEWQGARDAVAVPAANSIALSLV